MNLNKIFHISYFILNLLLDRCFRKRLKNVKKILLSAEAGIGDLLMFTPTIRVIRRCFPDAWICLVVAHRGSYAVLSGSGLVDEVIEYDQNDIGTFKKLRGHNFDLGFAAVQSMGWLTALLMYRCKAAVKVGHPFYSRFGLGRLRFKAAYPYSVAFKKHLHYVEQNLNLARRIGLKPIGSDKRYEFYLRRQNRDFALRYFKDNKLINVLAVHPGCHRPEATRCWDKFGQFINKFQKRYPEFDTLVIVGPDEIEMKDTLVGIARVDRIHIIHDISLKDIAAVLELCKVLVSSDSGIAHIACAVGIKTITIFGPAYPALSRPFLNNTVISADLPCQPCGRENRCSYNLECVRAVSVDNVIEAVEKTLCLKENAAGLCLRG